MKTLEKNTGVIILAAGSSSRLGQPKQLVKFRGKTLLQQTIDHADNFDFSPKILVLGANQDQITEQISLKNFQPVFNKGWNEGIASSLRVGITKAKILNTEIEHILILLSDQPFVSEELIKKLLESHSSVSNGITACKYGEAIGVPAIFSSHFFPDLLALEGDQGARKLIMKSQSEINIVPFLDGYFDVDTPEDLDKLESY